MKRLFLTIMAALTLTLSASAQRLLDVRGEAQYITDKMALELALTPSQRNSILQLNLTYLNGITSYRDIETTGWKYRNKHMKALLTPAQWKLYKKARCFYRPIGWHNDAYVHYIYAKYPRHNSHQSCKGPNKHHYCKDKHKPQCCKDKHKPNCCKDKHKPNCCEDKHKPHYCEDKHRQPHFGTRRSSHGNNSKEAIKLRKKMREHMRSGAR